MSDRRIVTFKAGYWYHEEIDGETIIHVGGRTADNKSVHVLIKHFTPFIYVELPRRIGWNKAKAQAFFHYLQRSMKSEGPIAMSLHAKYRLHYKKKIYTMFLSFPTDGAARKLQRKCSNARGFAVPGLGSFQGQEFKVHESNIDPVLKFTAAKKIKLSDWIQIRETIDSEEIDLNDEERKFTTADIDMYANWQDVSPVESESLENVFVPPKYCSFDIECNSKNHNSKLPNAEIPENVVFQIAMVFGFLGAESDTRHRILLSLGHPRQNRIENCDELFTFANENELLLYFSHLIQKHNPDIFIGYNIMKFDWNYMIKRAEIGGIYLQFAHLGRVMGKRADIRTISWSSSAYGEQKFSYFECHGRTNVDVLLEVERNFRLPKYTLDTVSEYFLSKKKDDVSPRGLFMLFQLTKEILPQVYNKNINIRDLLLHRKRIQEIFPIRKCQGIVKDYRARLLTARVKDFPDLCCEAMEITGKYCVQDTILPIELAEKLNLWTSMEEMSNVTNVPVSYLHTRGQQIKVLAQIYRRTIRQNIVIPNIPRTDKTEKYQGAMVVEANEGDYDLVATLDFASLYPTVIEAYNICYTTILEDSDDTPESEWHVLDWEDHVGCEHDLQKRKRKAEDVMCRHHRYRYRKVKYIIDENGNVERKFEGIMPSLERDLLAARKIYKKEMFKVQARIKMHKGTASEDDLEYYKKMGWEIIKPGSLGKNEAKMAEIVFNVLNAKQLAVKVSANSVDRKTPIPCKINGEFQYLHIEELFNTEEFEIDEYGNEICYLTKNILVWTDRGWTDVKYVFRHKAPAIMHRVITNTGCVNVTKDHSLLNEEGGKVKISNIEKRLLHVGTPLSKDSSDFILPNFVNDVKFNSSYQLETREERDAFIHGILMSGKCDDVRITGNYDRLPVYILNSTYDIRLAFFLGYCSNVGDSNSMVVKGELIAAGIMNIAKSVGYHVKLKSVDFDRFEFEFSKSPVDCCDEIYSIVDFETNSTDYVYDIETKNHHFAAGVGDLIVHNSAYGAMGVMNGMIPLIAGAASVTAMGRRLITMAIDIIKKEYPFVKLVYGDTDSCMIHFTGKTLQESFDYAIEASNVATHQLKCHIIGVPIDHKVGGVPIENASSKEPKFLKLPYKDQCAILDYESCPIDLEFENMYLRFLLLTKKRYVATIVNRKGEITGHTKKGVVLTRRDNSKYLRDTYGEMTTGILERKSEKEVMYSLYDRIHMLFTRQIPITHLIIYMGIKSIISYAKSRKEKKGRVVVSQVPIDINGDVIDDPIGPLDPRLVYPNYPQVILALKMIRRGEDIPPNTRLEYIYTKVPNAQHQGEKAEDYTYYKENKDIENLQPDELHYIEKQLMKPITELLTVKYAKGIVPYVSFEDNFRDRMNKLNDLHRYRVASITIYNKKRPSGDWKDEEAIIGWDVLKNEGYDIDYFNYGINLVEDKRFETYTYKKYVGQSTYILDQIKYEKGPNAISKERYPEFYNLCLQIKSVHCIDVCHKDFGLTRRRWKKPTYTGEKLRNNLEVVMINDSLSKKGIPKGAIGKIIDRTDLGSKGCEKYVYSILFKEYSDLIVNDIPRKSFTTFTYKDGNVMKDIFNYRMWFSDVISQIEKFSSIVKFIE